MADEHYIELEKYIIGTSNNIIELFETVKRQIECPLYMHDFVKKLDKALGNLNKCIESKGKK